MFKYRSPELSEVRLQDGFLAPRQYSNGKVTIPSAVRQCRDTGRIDAFRLQWRPGMPKKPQSSGFRLWQESWKAMAFQLMIEPFRRLAAN